MFAIQTQYYRTTDVQCCASLLLNKQIVGQSCHVSRQSFDRHSTYCDYRTTALRLFELNNLLVPTTTYYVTADNRTICGTTVAQPSTTDSRQSQDIDTTKHRRAKVVHVQLWLTTSLQHVTNRHISSRYFHLCIILQTQLYSFSFRLCSASHFKLYVFVALVNVN